MNRETYERLQETVVRDQLPNGLRVYVLPKPGFHKTYAAFSTRYGSIDNHFRTEGQEEHQVPDGIAHFLEHKMFEEPTGDVFAAFAAQGASANAFTTFDRTTYLFSATNHIHANLETLLNFVQNPYFTDANVEKEKGIIEQEIRMYQDNADYRVYYGLLEAMYHKHPVRIDIAGTVESIRQINKELLYTCYNTFYHPSNMSLVVAGSVDPDEILLLVRDNQAKKTYGKQGNIDRIFEPEPAGIRQEMKRTKMSVSIPKCLIGFKDASVPPGGETLLRQELETRVMLDVLFSSSSVIFQKLYDEHLITDQFSYEYNTGPGYAFSVIGGDTRDPDELVRRLREELERVRQEGIAAGDFERSRRKKIGTYLRMFNSLEAVANELTRCRFKDINLFDVLPVYESMTLEQVNRRFCDLLDWNRAAVSVVSGE